MINPINPKEIPRYWKRWRVMDWGYNVPYSVGWYTKDEHGTIIKYRELYGKGYGYNKGTKRARRRLRRRYSAGGVGGGTVSEVGLQCG